MADARCRVALPEEACARFGAPGERQAQGLDRDLLAEFCVRRLVHLTHAAAADDMDDPIVAELGAGRELARRAVRSHVGCRRTVPWCIERSGEFGHRRNRSPGVLANATDERI